jgi:hypothetical protein
MPDKPINAASTLDRRHDGERFKFSRGKRAYMVRTRKVRTPGHSRHFISSAEYASPPEPISR